MILDRMKIIKIYWSKVQNLIDGMVDYLLQSNDSQPTKNTIYNGNIEQHGA